MNPAQTISVARRANLQHDEFVEHYLRPLRPVILTDAINHWAALTKWTPDFFKACHGSVALTIDGQQYRMSDFIDLVLDSSVARPAPYLRNELLENRFPELLPDIFPMPDCTRPNWVESRLFPSKQSHTFLELYIGGRGAVFLVLHYDGRHKHAFLMQIYGAKQYVFYPPEQTALLPKPGVSNVSMVNDIEQPDLRQFPHFAEAAPIRCELHPGETLFVPSGWWHTARILSPSITVSINTANAANWRAFVRDYSAYAVAHRARPYRYALTAYLHALGLLERLVG
jgi:hypothetical protein